MKFMKWVALAGVMAISPAVAADVEPTDFSWTGLYVGAYGGYAWGGGTLADLYCDGVTPGRCTNDDDVPGTWLANTEMSDIIGGGLLGFNREFDGGFVLGGEMDLGFGGSAEKHFLFAGNLGETELDDDAIGNIDLGLTGSARVRVGYAMDRFLPFVTGGVAFAKYNATITNPTNSNLPRYGSGNLIGWTLGGGVNYAVTDHLIVGAEYRYTNLGDDDLNLTNAALDSDYYSFGVSDFVTQDVRLTATYKF